MRRIHILRGLPRQLVNAARPRRVTWLLEDRLAACRYPRNDAALRELADRGVTLLVNLHERPHAPELLAHHGLTEVHLPVPDFTPPAPEQLERGVAALQQAVASERKVAVHCGGGLGRTGTLLACYLVTGGLNPSEAIGRVRAARPGAVETPAQEAAVEEFSRRLGRK